MLDALEPVVQRDPPDYAETTRRVEEASKKYPGDAEFVYLQMAVGTKADPPKLLALAERCLELDPKYADCWQVRSYSLFRMAREQEALEALDRCVELAPSALDCLLERVNMHKFIGRCDQLEADVRRWITKDQSSALAYRELAVALASRSESAPAVSLAVEQAARRFKQEGKVEEGEELRIRLAILTGDFEEAERIAKGLEREFADEPLEEKHVVPARALVELYLETGEDRQAAEVADRFLNQRAAWTKPLHRTPWGDVTALFLRAKQSGGLMDARAHDAAIEAWARGLPEKATDVDRAAIWLNGYAAPARTADDARRALGLMPTMHPATYYSVQLAWTVEELVGGLHFLTSEYEQSRPYLEHAVRSCEALDDPLGHTIASYRLGVVREAQNDKEGACSAYRLVIARWGPTKKSRSARDAAARMKALKCGT